MPLMVEAFDVQTTSRCLWQWTAARIGDHDGHRVADESTLTAYSLAHQDRGPVRMTTATRITSLEFNAQIPASRFRMAPKDGTLVYNQDKQTFTRKGAQRKRAGAIVPPPSVGLPAVEEAGGQARRYLAAGGVAALVAALSVFLSRRTHAAV